MNERRNARAREKYAAQLGRPVRRYVPAAVVVEEYRHFRDLGVEGVAEMLGMRPASLERALQRAGEL